MKITLAQQNYTVGDFEGNRQKILQALEQGRRESSDLVVFPELSVTGYPPQDLLEHRSFVRKAEETVREIAREATGIAAIVGAPSLNPNPAGKLLYNTAYFLAEGTIRHAIHKTLLPTYDIFDEYRYFEPNNEFKVIEYRGQRLAVTICEDLWDEQPFDPDFSRSRLYTVSPMQELMGQKPDIIINLAASPFSYTRLQSKENIFRDNALRYKLPVINVNQTGANTELIFEGGSLAVTPDGKINQRLPLFQESILTLDTVGFREKPCCMQQAPAGPRLLFESLTLGVSDYFSKMQFSRAVLGLSGGIDSAVSLVVAAEALGPGKVTALLMPSPYSSSHSITDAEQLAKNLGVASHIIPINKPFSEFGNLLQPVFGKAPEGITEENIQSRIRGVLLMAYANHHGAVLLNTSNKSEAAVGYGTLYGDMAGGLAILGDVYKTQVYSLARHINREREIIPRNTIDKAPSAELKPGQKDTDSLPAYDLLDPILIQYIEQRRSAGDMTTEITDKRVVKNILKMVNASEHKRYQGPPVLRITSKAFGPGRRMPVVARFPEE